jgi:hypothetical protein
LDVESICVQKLGERLLSVRARDLHEEADETFLGPWRRATFLQYPTRLLRLSSTASLSAKTHFVDDLDTTEYPHDERVSFSVRRTSTVAEYLADDDRRGN